MAKVVDNKVLYDETVTLSRVIVLPASNHIFTWVFLRSWMKWFELIQKQPQKYSTLLFCNSFARSYQTTFHNNLHILTSSHNSKSFPRLHFLSPCVNRSDTLPLYQVTACVKDKKTQQNIKVYRKKIQIIPILPQIICFKQILKKFPRISVKKFCRIFFVCAPLPLSLVGANYWQPRSPPAMFLKWFSM